MLTINSSSHPVPDLCFCWDFSVPGTRKIYLLLGIFCKTVTEKMKHNSIHLGNLLIVFLFTDQDVKNGSKEQESILAKLEKMLQELEETVGSITTVGDKAIGNKCYKLVACKKIVAKSLTY